MIDKCKRNHLHLQCIKFKFYYKRTENLNFKLKLIPEFLKLLSFTLIIYSFLVKIEIIIKILKIKQLASIRL